MPEYYLAIDIGASSGRHILFWIADGMMQMEEVYRFPNGMQEREGHLFWDHDQLYEHILTGLKRCAQLGKIPGSVGIDTWGVDFVLLDENDQMLGSMVGYRDHRTYHMDKQVEEIIPAEELYARTGIQKAIINTIYQLKAVQETCPELLKKAKTFLTIPDYFHWKLCGVKANEYSEATTTQLINPDTRDWDRELIGKLGFPEEIFQKIVMPGEVLGEFTEEVVHTVGYRCEVVLPATHDTASAILAMPNTDSNALYISSGTWSLLGVELIEADRSVESRKANFTNEGGYDGRICYLKNIMGLWMIQSVKGELCTRGIDISFAQLCAEAEKETIGSVISCNDERFLSPKSMINEIQLACQESGQSVPRTPGELARVVYRSLAKCYGEAVGQLRKSRNCDYRTISILGGGSNAGYLNRLTARQTACTVYAGPEEATAIGNAIVQMLHFGKLESLEQARSCVLHSFKISIYDGERGECG